MDSDEEVKEIRNRDGSPSQDYEPTLVLNPSGEEPGLLSRLCDAIIKAHSRS